MRTSKTTCIGLSLFSADNILDQDGGAPQKKYLLQPQHQFFTKRSQLKVL